MSCILIHAVPFDEPKWKINYNLTKQIPRGTFKATIIKKKLQRTEKWHIMFLLNSFQFQSTLEEITFLPTQARALSSGD